MEFGRDTLCIQLQRIDFPSKICEISSLILTRFETNSRTPLYNDLQAPISRVLSSLALPNWAKECLSSSATSLLFLVRRHGGMWARTYVSGTVHCDEQATNFEYELVDGKMTAHFSASYNIDIFVAHRRRESIQIICRAESTQ